MPRFEHPPQCATEGQQLSRSFRAEELLRIEHNRFEGDHSPEAMAHRAVMLGKARIVQVARESALAFARAGNHQGGEPLWAVSSGDWNGSGVDFPPGLNQANEGSKMSYLARLKQVVEPEAIETRQADSTDGADHHRHRACRCGLVGPKGRDI